MKFIAVGVGPGDPDLITYGAVKALEAAELVLVPLSAPGRPSVAEAVVRAHCPDLETAAIHFPMIRDEKKRDQKIRDQLLELEPRWRGIGAAAMPVIGDSALYATAAYLYDVWKELEPGLELELVPGVSAHSLTAARAQRFLAIGEDVLVLIPGTAGAQAVERALAASDAAAVYKPMGLKDQLAPVVNRTGPWREILRVDRAGLPDQQILMGQEALEPAQEYLSTLLLWR